MAGKGSTTIEEAPVADEATEATGIEPTAEEVATAEEAKETGIRGRAQVKYFGQEGFEPEVLDELPEQAPADRAYAPSHLYWDLLVAVAGDVDNAGKWHKIAEFGSANGAQSIATDLNKQVAGNIGEERGQLRPSAVRNIPEYEGKNFVFQGVKTVKKDAEGNVIEGERASALYAKLVDHTEDAPVEAEATTEG